MKTAQAESTKIDNVIKALDKFISPHELSQKKRQPDVLRVRVTPVDGGHTTVAILYKNKQWTYVPKYSGINGLDGCLADKYNTQVYTAIWVAAHLGIIKQEEAHAFDAWLRNWDKQQFRDHELQRALELVKHNGYKVELGSTSD